MSLIFIDGFDHYATADLARKWDTVSGSPAINAAGGRRSGGCIEFDAAEYVEKTLSNLATITIGLAVKISSLSVTQDIIKFLDAGTVQLTIRVRTDGKIEAFRNGVTSLGASASAVFTAGIYSYLDCKITISDAGGVVLIDSGGSTVLNLSAVDTKHTANAYATAVRVGSDGTNLVSVDDCYIGNTSGSAPQNDRLGDCRIDVSYPTAEGNTATLTPLTGTNNAEMVDDAPNPDDDASYVSATGPGFKDTYVMQDFSAIGGGTIFAAQVNMMGKRDATGSRSIRAVARPTGTDFNGSGQSLETTYKNKREIWETNPQTAAAWTEANLNASEFGVEVSS
jgi:hypothetical protein